MAIAYADIKPEVERLRASVDMLAGRAAADDAGPSELRRFHMVAYTGAQVSRLYGAAVFDLDGIERGEQVPILFNHDESQIAGYADEVSLTDRGLELSGYLSRVTEAGRTVEALSDEGLRWQASVGLAVSDWEELNDEDAAEVNGSEVKGPLSIGRKSRLLEVSFVTAGADQNTSAIALSSREARMKCPKCGDEMAADDPKDEDEDKPEDAAAEDEEKKDDEDMAAGPSVSAVHPDVEALKAEVAALRGEVAKSREALSELAALKAEARHPGVGFDGPAREQLAPARPKTPDEAWESDERLRAEFFHKRSAFDAYVRREGWTPKEA